MPPLSPGEEGLSERTGGCPALTRLAVSPELAAAKDEHGLGEVAVSATAGRAQNTQAGRPYSELDTQTSNGNIRI